jgi:hypothetical protein
MVFAKVNWGIILAALLIVAVAACGGSGSDPNPNNLPPGDNPTGLQGNVYGPAAPGDYPQLQPIEGDSPEAPLGTDPAYNVEPGGSDTIQVSSLKDSSALGPNEAYKIVWQSIVRRGETPIPGQAVTGLHEGDKIDLYLQYEAAANAHFSREWYIEAAGLFFIEPDVVHSVTGVYRSKFEFQLPYDCAGTARVFQSILAAPRTTSLVVIDPTLDSDGVMEFDITETVIQPPIEYPIDPPGEDPTDDCLPDWINVSFQNDNTQVLVVSEKDLSNVVLKFLDFTVQKWDNLSGKTGTYYGTGANANKKLRGVWVKSGCNSSGDGPGYGEFFPNEPVNAQAIMVWEDLIVNSDYDYNDLVASMHVTEYRNLSNQLVQVDLMVKALARGAGYTSDWQFNMGAAFPGATVTALVSQYYANGQPHGDPRMYQNVWLSQNGMSVPVFAPTRDALPIPPDHSYATNVVAGTTYIEGDYALVKIILGTPLAQGTYTPSPYKPELRVRPSGQNVYIVGLWKKPGDPVDSNGRPLAFIVSDTFAWPMESKKIWSVFPGFSQWVTWINNQSLPEPSPWWGNTEPVKDYFDRRLFK